MVTTMPFHKRDEHQGTEKIDLIPLARGEYNINYTFIVRQMQDRYPDTAGFNFFLINLFLSVMNLILKIVTKIN